MPKENINNASGGERTEVGWEKDGGPVEVCTAPVSDRHGWRVSYVDRGSINRIIWALGKARDEAFGPDPADVVLTRSRALAEAARNLEAASKTVSGVYVTVADGWLTLARELA